MPGSVLYTAFDVIPAAKGASTHITAFVRGLVGAGYRVTLISAGQADLPAQETYYGATHLRAPVAEGTLLQRTLAYANYALKHLESVPPYDVIHTRSVWDAAHWPRIRPYLPHTRFLYEMNGLPSVELPHHYPHLPPDLIAKLRRMEHSALSAADRVITVSEVGRRYLIGRGVPPRKITVIPNGIDPAHFFPAHAPAQPDEVRPDKIRPDEILYVGTLAAWQGLPALIQALGAVREHAPARLRIVGAGKADRREALAAEIGRLGLTDAVVFQDAVPHEAVADLIRAAAVCVAPLRADDRNIEQGACPLKILEYMACGRPVVASDLPIVREITAEGACALLVRPDDPAALAEGLTRLLADPAYAADLGKRAAAYVQANFTWAAAIGRLVAVYAALRAEPSADTGSG